MKQSILGLMVICGGYWLDACGGSSTPPVLPPSITTTEAQVMAAPAIVGTPYNYIFQAEAGDGAEHDVDRRRLPRELSADCIIRERDRAPVKRIVAPLLTDFSGETIFSGSSSSACAFRPARAILPANLPGDTVRSGKCSWSSSDRRAAKAPCRRESLSSPW